MKKLEQKFCTELQKWIKYNMSYTFCWEAKVARNGRLYLNEPSFIKEFRNLKVCGSQLVHKFSDLACGTIFDGISIYKAPGYLFVQFDPEKKKFYVINITTIQTIINNGDKSINEFVAAKIAYKIGELK